MVVNKLTVYKYLCNHDICVITIWSYFTDTSMWYHKSNKVYVDEVNSVFKQVAIHIIIFCVSQWTQDFITICDRASENVHTKWAQTTHNHKMVYISAPEWSIWFLKAAKLPYISCKNLIVIVIRKLKIQLSEVGQFVCSLHHNYCVMHSCIV